MAIDVDKLSRTRTPAGLPFQIGKLGHVVIHVSDLERSTGFYTQVLGFRVTDVYPEDMMPGGMVFLRCNGDHHCLALVGRAPDAADAALAVRSELHHIAFEVPTLDDVFRAREHLRRHEVPIDFEGRRRAGCQVALEFHDPDGHHLEIYWGVDQVGTDGRLRPASEWRPSRTLEDAIADAPPDQDVTLRDPSLRR
ncbi:MAG TPA: VOC family protein [bacterium]|nr:VOC family protein [bacterium]